MDLINCIIGVSWLDIWDFSSLTWDSLSVIGLGGYQGNFSHCNVQTSIISFAMTFLYTLDHILSYSLWAVGMGTGVMGIKMLHSITGLMSFILLLIKLSKNIWLCFSGTGSLERNCEVTFCPFHGQRRLVSYSLWDHKELDMTECTCCICSVVVGY